MKVHCDSRSYHESPISVKPEPKSALESELKASQQLTSKVWNARLVWSATGLVCLYLINAGFLRTQGDTLCPHLSSFHSNTMCLSGVKLVETNNSAKKTMKEAPRKVRQRGQSRGSQPFCHVLALELLRLSK